MSVRDITENPPPSQLSDREILDALNGIIGLVQIFEHGNQKIEMQENHRFLEALRVAALLEAKIGGRK